MIAAWMLWSIGVGVLLLVAGLAAEKLLEGSRRWVWVVAGAGTVGLTAARVFGGGGAGSGEASVGLPVMESFGAFPVNRAAEAFGEASTSGLFALTIPADSILHSFDGMLLLVWVVLSVGLAMYALIGTGDFLRRRRDWQPGTLLGQPVLWSRDTGPAVVGLLRPTVVLPSSVRALEARKQMLILAHEQEHRRAGDAVLRFAATALLVVFPWNPALWYHYRRLCLAIEFDCDHRVMRRLPHRRWLYGDLLFQFGSSTGARAGIALAAFAEQRSFLEKRIRKLLSKAPEVGMAQIAFLAFAAILVVGVAMWVPGITREAADDPASLIGDANPGDDANIVPIPEADVPPAPEAARNIEYGPWVRDTLFLPSDAQPEIVVSGFAGQTPTVVWRFSDGREVEMLLPPGAEPIEVEAEAEGEGVGSRPQFVAHTRAPVLLNEEDLRLAMDREYPALLKDAGIGGTTIVYLFVDTDGKVRNQRVSRTSNHEALDEAALKAAPVAVFSPAMNGETPVAVWIELPITFKAG